MNHNEIVYNKKCTKCNEDKCIEAFPKEAKRKDGRYPWCRVCLSDHRRKQYINRVKKFSITHKVCTLCKKNKERTSYRQYAGPNQKPGHLHHRCIECEDNLARSKVSGKKQCYGCRKVLALELFTKSKRSKDGVRSQCRECIREYCNRVKDKRKNTSLIKHYGITLEDYTTLLNNQGSACAICRKTEHENGKMLCVDHVHGGPRAGNIRGLLCDTCNKFIVWKHNTGDLLKRAADYVDGFRTDFYVPKNYTKGKK